MFRLFIVFFLSFASVISANNDTVAVSDKDQPKQVESPDETYPAPGKKEPGDVVKKKKKQMNNKDDWGPKYPGRARNLNQIDRYIEPGEKEVENDPNKANRMGPGTNLNELEKEKNVDYDEGLGEKSSETLGNPSTDLNKENEAAQESQSKNSPESLDGPGIDLNKMDSFDNNESKKPTIPSKKKPSKQPSSGGVKKTKVEGVDRYSNGILIQKTKGLILFANREDLNLLDRNELVGFHTVNIDIPGDPKMLEKRLNRIYLGKPLTRAVIKELISAIESFFNVYDRPLTKVVVPRQGISNGVLSLLVVQAQLGKITSKGNIWLSDERLQEYVRLQPGEVIDERTLRESIGFINRNPFRTVEAVYEEGAHYQTTDIEIIVKERSPFRVYTGADNMGLSAIDRTRFFAGFNYGDLFGADQIFSYQYTFSKSFRSYQSHTASYTIPLPWQHVLEFYGGYSSVRVKMEKPFDRNTGSSSQASGRYTIPFPMYVPGLDHEFRFGGDFKQLNNTFEFIEDFPRFGSTVNLTQVMAGYEVTYSDPWFKTNVDVNGYFSPGRWLANQTDADYNSLRDGAKAYYAYARGEVKLSFFFWKDSALDLRAAGQWASIPLIPSEQFGLGGLETVRGYEERTLNGDQAVLATAELKFPSFGGLIRPRSSKSGIVTQDMWQIVLFCDYGSAYLKADQLNTTDSGRTFNEPKAQYLFGAGPGVRYQIGHYFYAKCDIGYKIKKDRASYGGGNIMVHFSAVASY